MTFGETYDGETCNYSRECKQRSLYPTGITETEMGRAEKGFIPTKLKTSTPTTSTQHQHLQQTPFSVQQAIDLFSSIALQYTKSWR
jgi:hypothetical protein